MPESLPMWHQWVLLVVQILGLIFLVIYVVKTWEMAAATRAAAEASNRAVEEASEARKESLAPRVLVYFGTQSSLAQVEVYNAGAGTAQDVEMVFDPPLQSTQPSQSQQYFSAVQPILPPGYRHAQTFDTWPTYLASDLPRDYHVTIRYRGAENGRKYEVTYLLSAEALRWQHIQKTDADLLSEELRKMRDSAGAAIRNTVDALKPILWLGALDSPSPRSAEAAARNLIGVWHLVRHLDEQERAYYPRAAFADLLRQRAIALAHFLPDIASTNQRSALLRLTREIFSIEWEYGRSGDRSQHDDLFEEVASAFGVIGRRPAGGA